MALPVSEHPSTSADPRPRGRSPPGAAGAGARGARALARARRVRRSRCAAREGAEQWVFYEGPPTANGPPGSHHVLSRVFKDIYPRYQTMRGYRVERKGGWDCHGLPVEIAVEQELGIQHKAEIEEYGIAEFNAKCRESVFTYLEEWNRLTERIGFWLDLENAYRTLDETYIESVWWALSEIDAQGAALRGPQGRALLPALRDDAVLPRGRPRLPGRGRPERVPEAASVLDGGRAAAGLDDDAVDAAGQRGGRGRARRRPTPGSGPAGRSSLLAEARVAPVLGERRGGPRAHVRRRARRSASAPTAAPIFAAERPPAGRACRSWPTTSSRPRTARASSTSPPPSARTTTAWPPPPSRSRSTRPARRRSTTRSAATAPTTGASAAARATPTRAASSRTRR